MNKDRTIPTRVGKTAPRPPIGRPWPDHPHTRGENPRCSKLMVSPSGPSPHAWGKRFSSMCALPVFRTIPTRVGKTKRAHSYDRRTTDHPHTRGENLSIHG